MGRRLGGGDNYSRKAINRGTAIIRRNTVIKPLLGKENKRRLQTLSIDNAWSNKNFLVHLTFRMLQHTSSEVNGYNCYKHLKIQK